MPIQDFSFSKQKASDPTKRQAVLALQNEEDINCLSKALKKLRYHIIGSSQKAPEIVEFLRKNRTGVLFIDIDIEKLGATDFVSKIKINCPDFKVVVIAEKMDKQQVEEAKKAGVVGFLAKPLTDEAVIKLLSKSCFN